MRPVLLLFVVAGLAPAEQAVMRLGLKEAVDLALAPDGNARARIAAEMVRQAQARSAQARAALLPNVDASMVTQNQTRNLAAFGIQIQLHIPGFHFPELVGPFSTMDLRASATQSVFDISAIRRYQASRAGLTAAKAENDAARNQVTDAVARAYLAALRARAALESVKANLTVAESLLKLVRSQKAAGTGTGIEVTRAEVQLANERQRLLVTENEVARADLQLLKLIGLNLGTKLELTDTLGYVPMDPITIDAARELARRSRPELKAQQGREESARLSYSAARLERVPALAAFGDYGTIGAGLDPLLPTRSYGLALRVPLFDGGRRDARRAEAASALRLEQIRTKDMEAQVELEARLALEAIESAGGQVKTAAEGLHLADNELAQARRRYEAGVTTSLEITDAQARLERARENRIAALVSYNAAQIDLNTALGRAQEFQGGR
ncbi:MAG: TolC family protein [Acidobacteria bacterium]|nr:TolC family protein [Acidobacteriota bacterium]